MEEIIRLEADIKNKKSMLRMEKKRYSERFRREHKSVFKFLHIIMVFIVLFNFGALTITHFMVNKVKIEEAKKMGKEILYFETVTATAKKDSFQTVEDIGLSPEEVKVKKLEIATLFYALFKQSFIWGFIYCMYYIYHRQVYTYTQLYIIIGVVALYFSITGYDFFYDLGLLIAEVKYGN